MKSFQLPAFTSDKFRFWSFTSMVLLVFVHGYNLEQRYLRPWSIVYEPLSVTGFVEYFLANGIFRFRIPMLFAISGYLYALHDTKPNKQRFVKRLRTLLVPYLCWSALALGFTWVLETFSVTRELIISSNFFRRGDEHFLLHHRTPGQLLDRWLLHPVAYQLWFLRVLVVYCLAYPLLKWFVTSRRCRAIYFVVAGGLWLVSFETLFVEGEGLLFFSLGIWLQKTNYNIEQAGRRFKLFWWGLAFTGLALLKTWLACIGPALVGDAIFYLLTALHKMVVLTGLIFCWFGLDFLVRWCMARKWFTWLSAFSFFIFAMHAPAVAFAINAVLSWLYPLAAYRAIAFVLLPVLIITICIATGFLLRRFAPRVYSLLTGGRGL